LNLQLRHAQQRRGAVEATIFEELLRRGAGLCAEQMREARR